MTNEGSVQNWVSISSSMIGVSLTILTLVLTLSGLTTEGRILFAVLGGKLIIYLLLAAFILFVNAVTTNSRVLYEVSRNATENFINRWIKFAEYSWGFGFTLIIITFALATYMLVGDIIAPTVLMGVAWLIMLIYTFLNDPADKGLFAALRSWKRNIWIIIELAFLILIYIDAFNLIKWTTIPL